MTQPVRPFADAVLAYAQAGWPCIMPVPPEKSPPPVGFTGADGKDTDAYQLAVWAGSHGDSSIALRMPDGVIGIDVDQYEKTSIDPQTGLPKTVVKHGLASVMAATARWGTLPATWTSTARDAGGPSRISFYRAPAGRYATKLEGGDVEIIQRHHRYAVVWPSPHLDAGTYTWYDPNGAPSDQPPKPSELPELPVEWIVGLQEGATDQGPSMAGYGAGEGLLGAILADPRPPCGDLASAFYQARDELTKVDAGSRHDTATARVHHLVQLAAHGHPGLGQLLPELVALWDALTAGEHRGDEFERMLLTSARKAVTVVGERPVGNDPCLFMGTLQLPAPAPANDNPDGEDLPPVEQPRAFHPLEVIGAGLFDPIGQLDQVLAEAVLERTWPALRYAYDAKSWLCRGVDSWVQSPADLTEWAVSLVAGRMPHGDPDADKGSAAFAQAVRRRRFMSAGPAGGVAKKMRSLVASEGHPVALKIAELDREAWLMWAGGIGWDLRASAHGPMRAMVDPAVPHLRSAAVAPDPRPTPLWDAFTTAVWPDPELRHWALRVLSIAVTGYSDKALPILIGEKDRGKTQVVALLMSVLGSYAHAADPRLLTGADNAHASIIYALMGRRLSFIDEGPRGNPAGQERLKQLTGGGDLTGNQMNANPITFSPTHTLVLTTNDDPHLTDPAVRGRARLIPCEGDPAEVIASRRAIGDVDGLAWRREAPGVLAAMMAHAAGWLADQATAATDAAPEAYRWRGEQIAAEQNPITNWLSESCEQYEPASRSRELFTAFVGWCKDGNLHASRIPTETKWGKELTRIGYPIEKRRDGNYRKLRIRLGGGWNLGPPAEAFGGGLGVKSGGLVEGSSPNPPQPTPPVFAATGAPEKASVEGVESSPPPLTHAHAHTHACAHEQGEPYPPPSTVLDLEAPRPANTGPSSVEGTKTPTLHTPETRTLADNTFAPPAIPPYVPISGLITARLLEARAETLAAEEARRTDAPVLDAELVVAGKPKRVKVDPAERAAAKLSAKAQALSEAITAAGGPLVDLPALVTRDGTVTPLALPDAAEAFAVFEMAAALTVDVEHTGYPIGHPDYALRTIQLGNHLAALVFDADDASQRTTAGDLLRQASRLHAHSATADLVPLAIAGVIEDLDAAWLLMEDTVIPALLADPQSTGSDADGLKELARDMLGEGAVSTAADLARGDLFKAGKWLKDTKVTTAIERSGWAQTDRRSTTMVRYGAADVLDTAALARVLPPVAPPVLERERTAQRMTARAAYTGIRLDGEHVGVRRPEHQAALAEAAARIRAFGIENAGSDQQVAAKLIELGAPLPRTATGRPSVAKDGLASFAKADGPVGDLVRARLDYQHHETVLSLFLDPYSLLVNRGDGRARPTVYTLGADTGRMSCVRPNLQQVPRQGGIRSCITADPGQVIISADFASVEVRVAAALTGDPNLQALLAADIDLHWTVARQAYGPDATKEDRYGTKRGVFAWFYGSAIPGIARTLGISEFEAAAIVDSLRAIAPGVAPWIAGLKQAVQRGMHTFETYSGRVVHLDARQPHKAFNYLVQGTARELLVDTLVRWQDTRWRDCVLLPVHDEVLVFVPEADAEEATAALVAAMETQLLGVAIKAEASAPSFAWKDAS